MIKSEIKKLFFLLIVLLAFVLFFYKFSSEFIEIIVRKEQIIKSFINENFIFSIFIATITIIIATSLMCPMSPFIILVGFFYDFYSAFLITVIGETIGAIIVFIYVKWFFKNYFKKKFGKYFKNIEVKFNKNSLFYLLALRIVGGTPFFIENILPAIFNMKFFPYTIGTFLGVMPWAFIIVGIGSGFQMAINANINGVETIMSSSFVFYSFIFALLIILIIFLKNFFNKDDKV